MLTPDGKHFPRNPDKFVFDEEVAAIFDDIAARSIPHYHAAHRLHAGLAARSLSKPNPRILDVGASLGAFYSHLTTEGAPLHGRKDFTYVAVDNSAAMCEGLKKRHGDAVTTIQADVLDPEWLPADYRSAQYDVVCCYYVIQFLPPDVQYRILAKLARMVAPGGCFFLGHKIKVDGRLGAALHEQYIQWRMANGYTRAEIDAKTAALKNSMWVQKQQDIITRMEYHFTEVQETTRFTVFATLAAFK